MSVLFDFDGPITYLFGGSGTEAIANKLSSLALQNFGIPAPQSTDPLRVLQAMVGEAASTLDAALTEIEVEAASVAQPTPGVIELFKALDGRHRIGVVSNNSAAACNIFAQRFNIDFQVIVGRTFGRPELMKPNPHPVRQAMMTLPDSFAYIGDSVTDVEVALTCGLTPIGFGKTKQRAQELAKAGAESVVLHMSDVLDALSACKHNR